MIAADRPLLGQCQPERLGQLALGSGEADGQQHELAREDQFRAVELLELPLPGFVKILLNPHRVQLLDLSTIITDEGLGLDLPVALSPLLVSRRDPEDLGPERPGGLGVLTLGGARIVVELGDRSGLLAVAGSQAVGSGISTADDDDVLPGGQDRLSVHVDAVAPPVLLGQERHRRLDSLEVPPRDLEITRLGCAHGQEQGVVAGSKLAGVDRPADADLGVQNEADPFLLELIDPPLDIDLGHLEVGDAVSEQSARPVVSLVDRHGVAGPAELLGRGQPGRSAADDRHGLARLLGGWPGDDPAHLPAPIHDRRLDVLDGHRGPAQGQNAR